MCGVPDCLGELLRISFILVTSSVFIIAVGYRFKIIVKRNQLYLLILLKLIQIR